MKKLELDNVCKTYENGVNAVKGFSLDVEKGEFIVLVGPSGCGKSTMLRMIAGLEDISSGSIHMNQVDISSELARNRNVTMIFQNYALYPHMTVYDNMAFCLKQQKKSKAEIESSVNNTAARLEIENLLQRKPKALSGGEKQRVAMGRAIVRNPELFLMDEPLSNLDAKLRGKMRREIARLHKELGATIIYVTHDQVEAMTLGTKIVVMNEGEIQQIATPQNLYLYPANTFVAQFIGAPQMNLMEMRIGCSEVPSIENDLLSIPISKEMHTRLKSLGYSDKDMIIGVRPEDIDVCILSEMEDMKGYNVTDVEYQGNESFATISLGENELIIRLKDSGLQKSIAPLSNVAVSIPSERIHLFDKETTKRIAI